MSVASTFASLLALWMIAFAATLGALSKMGEARTDTYGDCWTGDYCLDTMLAALWPVFWPSFAAFRLGAVLARQLEGPR